MKRFLKAASVILSALIVFSSLGIAVYSSAETANAPAQYKNEYPYVFVHGLNGWGGGEGINGIVPYWGATTGDLTEYLRSEGYECYSASVGPISSAWDRACELYAQLTGTVVDYGEAHSLAHNHRRYGRSYDEPLFEGWGERNSDGNVKKINLIGHSFGGTTARMLAYLLTYGCEDEVNASGENVSPLFTGGKEYLVCSVTTIATPHNSATTYKFVKDTGLYELFRVFSAAYCCTLGRSLFNGRLVDFHLEQFGITNTPGERDSDEYFSSLINFLKNSDDTCEYDLTPDGTAKLNGMIETSPNIYYFSYAFDATHDTGLAGLRLPDITGNPIIAPLGLWICLYPEYADKTTGQVYDESWRANDLLCNTISETYPFDEEHVDYDFSEEPETGIWNVMPVQKGDHGQAIGLLSSKDKTRGFFLELSEALNELS